jgi:hypothetical protein
MLVDVDNTQESQMPCFSSSNIRRAWEEVVTIPNFSKNPNVDSSKVVGTWHCKNQLLRLLGFWFGWSRFN